MAKQYSMHICFSVETVEAHMYAFITQAQNLILDHFLFLMISKFQFPAYLLSSRIWIFYLHVIWVQTAGDTVVKAPSQFPCLYATASAGKSGLTSLNCNV